MKKTLTILLLLLYSLGQAVAQVNGVGNGTAPDPAQNVSNGILYTDNVRTPVTRIMGNGTLPPNPRFIVDIGSSSGLNVGDMVLIIQMKDPANTFTGNHQNAIVDMVNSATRVTVHTVSTGPAVPFMTGAGYKVQMIKINQYLNFTINSGEVACHPWDNVKGTGGVLCFVVRNTFKVNGGIFNAAGKGYTPAEAVWGVGGAGAAGATVLSGVGNPAPVLNIGCTGRVALTGTDGGAANNPGGPGTLNTLSGPVYTPPAHNYYTKAVMGKAGYFQNGYGGGNGAGGGGKGGTGATTCAGAGLAGANGNAGDNGGDPGQGASGGGIIIIKATAMSILPATSICFTARGQNGDNGRAGGNGGQGGAGGAGAAGICPTCDPGGPGGKGATGVPGDGGDGGDGGSPGIVWIAAGSVSPAGLSPAKVIDVAGGTGGKGGPGGFSWSMLSYPFLDDPCGPSCPPPGPCSGVQIIRVCDRFKAFCHLAAGVSSSMHTPGNNGVNNGYDFTNSSGTLVAIYDIDNNELDGVEFDPANCIEIHYVAPLFSVNDCGAMFKKIAYGATLQPSKTGQIVDLTLTNDNGTCNALPTPPTINFKDIYGKDMFIFHGDQDYIEDLSEPGHPRCYTGPCSPVDAYQVGNPGGDGITPEPGTVIPEIPTGPPSDPGANGIIQTPSPMWRQTGIGEMGGIQDDDLVLYPNPVTDVLNIQMPPVQAGLVEITDITGKIVYRENTAGDKLSVNVAQWAGGVYIVKLYNDHVLLHTAKLVKLK